MPAIVDYSQPLATIMKESTIEVHNEVEHSEGAKLLLSGELPKEEYARFLMMLWYIYDTLERGLDRHSTHPVLEPTYNPALLRRTPSLAADISHILQVPESAWKTHPLHQELMSNTPDALTEYIERIQDLVNSEDPSPLLAHSYVRYLGDLSGGQNIRTTLSKAYGLSAEDGLSFYVFKELQTSKPASIGEMKRIKDWFRDGMNKGGKAAKEDMIVELADEAKKVFLLNSGIFSAIRTAAPKRSILMDKTSTPLTEKAYPLSSVLSVIAAVCIAHFLLVVGGFTGEKGYSKLLTAEEWVASLFTSN
ncbi:hypothetical protein CPB85DRAFT_1224246 [Mucidula mucida]|nr:hypothetical protein CPB85DRAFT_1224246 [Mucidula mucida]